MSPSVSDSECPYTVSKEILFKNGDHIESGLAEKIYLVNN